MIPPTEKPTNNVEPAVSTSSESTRRIIDTGSVVAFHVTILAVMGWLLGSAAQVAAVLAVLILGLDFLFFSSPPAEKPILAESSAEQETKAEPVRAYAFELLVLLAPPALLVSWFLFLTWNHRTMTQIELIAVLIAIPADVAIVTRIVRKRLKRNLADKEKHANHTTSFVGLGLIGTWLGSPLLFILLLLCFFMRLIRH